MSAFLVDRVHIDLLTDCVLRGPSGRAVSPYDRWDLNSYLPDELRSDPDAIGRCLWVENLRSIHYRYPDTASDTAGENRPGPVGVSDFEINGYTFTRQPYQMNAGEAAKAAACLRYQSCEHPEWEASNAARIIRDLEGMLVGMLPGYEGAPWDWMRKHVEERRPVTITRL